MLDWSLDLTALDLLRAPGRRFRYVDIMRGSMISLVVIAHTFGQAHLAADSWIGQFNPTGWATKVFVMLTGFSAVVILGAENPEKSERIYRRAIEVGLIAWTSNALSIAWSQRALSGLWDGLFFGAPWTISQYLLPTTLVLAVAPHFCRIMRRIGVGVGMLATLTAAFGVDVLIAVRAFEGVWLLGFVLYGNDTIQISLAHFCLAALAAMSLAMYLVEMVKANRFDVLNAQWRWAFGLALAALIVDTFFEDRLGWGNDWINQLVAWARFVVFMQLSLWVARNLKFGLLRMFAWLVEPIGQSALLIFIGHRPLVHFFGAMALKVQCPEGIRLVMMIVLVFVVLRAFLAWRMATPKLDQGLAAVGL